MFKVFVDLEMHPIPRSFQEERQICTQEIIEIGAVKLNEQNEEVSSFCEFVKPGYVSKIYSKFQKLTGISTADVEQADPIAVILPRSPPSGSLPSALPVRRRICVCSLLLS